MNIELLTHILEEIHNGGAESGEIEICGESANGADAWETFDVCDICKKAIDHIEAQEKKIEELDINLNLETECHDRNMNNANDLIYEIGLREEKQMEIVSMVAHMNTPKTMLQMTEDAELFIHKARELLK